MLLAVLAWSVGIENIKNNLGNYLQITKLAVSPKKTNNTIGLEDLTPHSDKEFLKNQETYINALKWGVENENVKNIALTGGYGTGKSTILNTFKNENGTYEYLEY